MSGQRRQRADGRASRAAILDAPERTRRLAACTLAGPDGLFIAADDDRAIDLAEEFELLGHDVPGAARSMGSAPPVRSDEAEHRGAGR